MSTPKRGKAWWRIAAIAIIVLAIWKWPHSPNTPANLSGLVPKLAASSPPTMSTSQISPKGAAAQTTTITPDSPSVTQPVSPAELACAHGNPQLRESCAVLIQVEPELIGYRPGEDVEAVKRSLARLVTSWPVVSGLYNGFHPVVFPRNETGYVGVSEWTAENLADGGITFVIKATVYSIYPGCASQASTPAQIAAGAPPDYCDSRPAGHILTLRREGNRWLVAEAFAGTTIPGTNLEQEAK